MASVVDHYDKSRIPYDPSRGFVAPTFEQAQELAKEMPHITAEHCNDPNVEIDNRIAIRILLCNLTDGDLPREVYERIVEPYDIGFYRKSDGKSTPLRWLKVTRKQRRLGVRKDIVSVRHDLDYYRGRPKRRRADGWYRRSQRALGNGGLLTWLEYGALRLAGRGAWRSHARKRDTVPGYGQDPYIPQLEDTPPIKVARPSP